MKHMKKLIAVMLTFVMAFAMAATVFAETTTYTLTIDNAKSGHVYGAYQVFSGKLAGNVLTDVEWGEGVDGAKILTKLNEGKSDGEKYKSAADVAKALEGNTLQAADFADIVANYLTTDTDKVTTSGSYDEDNKKYEIEGLEAGYYFVKDNQNVPSDDAYTKYILKVVKNITMNPKSAVPTSEKKVKDINDSTDATTDWQDSADYDIGDKVPFKLKGTVAENFDDYTVYKYVFHDKESAGLTFDESTVKVYVDETKIPAIGKDEHENYRVIKSVNHGTEAKPNMDTFDVQFADLKSMVNEEGTPITVTKDSVITVEYKSTLNERAVIGSVGNPNVMHLEFSNNPNDKQGGETGKTPDDKVIVFTYKTVINKTNENNEPLSGAAFKLEKFVIDSNGADTYKEQKGNWVEKASTTLNNGTTFSFKGLDDGYYRLTEIEAPATYNKLKDSIYFEISATHETEAPNPTLTDLSGNKLSGEITFTRETEEGKEDALSADVVNKKGATLPETGGMGTTIFYIIGAILIIGSGVLMITRRRMGKN